ncbi:MAG: Y-family DNA polymerase [Chitinophagaceae bacterium]|nr:Y-family DNA polymerase [Chitinophagaceae bacterium]
MNNQHPRSAIPDRNNFTHRTNSPLGVRGMKAIVDCNNFYCSCERLFKPSLLNHPVVVLSNNDGCIISRSDEAKKLGVGMAAPYYQNREIIEKNKVAVFSSNYNLYGDLSMRVMDTLRKLVGEEKVEVYSVDESFLDLSHLPPDELSKVSMEIRQTVEQWTGIAVSIGVAPSKVLSKTANRLAKKDKQGSRGVMVLQTADEIREALEKTRVDDLWGVGRQFAFKLHQMGIDNGWQLSKMPEEWARKNMGGVVGVRLIRELNGIPCIPMKDPLEVKKMIATTRMFGKPVFSLDEIREAVATYTSRAAEKLRRQSCAAGMIQVFVVTNGNRGAAYEYNPQSRYQYCILPHASSDTSELIRHALPLTELLYQPGVKYLKAGVILSQLVPDHSIQANLFSDGQENRRRILMEAMDNINFSQRDDIVKYVASGLTRNWKMRQEMRSKRFTTRWDELYEVP